MFTILTKIISRLRKLQHDPSPSKFPVPKGNPADLDDKMIGGINLTILLI